MIKLKQGFSLVELLVVLAVIAIISGISIFALNDVRIASRDARRKADMETIRSALELYKSDCGSYPVSLSGGSSLTGPSGSPCAGNVYMQTVPSDPTSGSYLYIRGTAVTTYNLCVRLEQGTGTTPCGPSNVLSCSGGNCNYKVTNP